MFNVDNTSKKHAFVRFRRQLTILIWKSYNQRVRRWRILTIEVLFAAMCFLVAIFIARPVFMTPTIAEGGTVLTTSDILLSLDPNTEISYAPNRTPYNEIMSRASELLKMEIDNAYSVDNLLQRLHDRSVNETIKNPIIWVIWKSHDNGIWKLSVQSSEMARETVPMQAADVTTRNKHLKSGFLAVQAAVSQAVIEYSSIDTPNFELELSAIPVTPLMNKERARRAISLILICFTSALLPAVLESLAISVGETTNGFKRALRMRQLDFSTMYVAWMVYAQLSVFPICTLAAITLIVIFRWIHLFTAFMIMFTYVSVMIMIDFILGMFHHKVWLSCVWSAMLTILQTFIAELMIHHKYDYKHPFLVFMLNVIIPPLGLVHVFHEFALLQIGGGFAPQGPHPLWWIILSWVVLVVWYFGVLMLLQRTKAGAIGGAVNWKSIIFKRADNPNRLRRIESPHTNQRTVLQEVDELVAKAISFQNVHKRILEVPMLSNVSFDVYRGEFTMLYGDPIDQPLLTTLEDLLTGLTLPDKGDVIVLGHKLQRDTYFMTLPYMLGYCHDSNMLIQDLTVEEHIILFIEISIWNEPYNNIHEYQMMRMKKLFAECNLLNVARVQVKNLSKYYIAQLCWAIAVLLEPRIVFIPQLSDDSEFIDVIKDKIKKYNGYLTIIKICYTSVHVQFANRVFIFDDHRLVFGGTPRYLFYNFGREYRLRVTVRSGRGGDSDDTDELLARAKEAGATVRAHHGSMVVLRLPPFPTANVTSFIRDLTNNAELYSISSFHLSLPDMDEVCMRAVTEFSADKYRVSTRKFFKKEALKKIAEPVLWRRRNTRIPSYHQFLAKGKIYYSFYRQNKTYIAITGLASIMAGIAIGLSLGSILKELKFGVDTESSVGFSTITVEARNQKTILMLRADPSHESLSLANAYVLSSPNSLQENVAKISYTGLLSNESLEDYLIVRAIDAPQDYVHDYSYGMDIFNENGTLLIKSLYSPLHEDSASAARSLARTHMALLRHYTGIHHATIEVVDDPLALDLTTSLESVSTPPLLIEFLLILTMSHTTLVPSHEFGLIRHAQAHAMDFSPARYWLALFFCDIVVVVVQISLITTVMFIVLSIVIPAVEFSYVDLAIIPYILFVYALGCIPEAYLFSLGSSPGLNVMTYITVNVVFGETTIVARLFYGYFLKFLMLFMNISPQFNMAYAYVKIKHIFAQNNECLIFDTKLCSSSFLHRCCNKYCGVMEECFKRASYFGENGIVAETIALITTSLIFSCLLMLWEYKWIERAISYCSTHWLYRGRVDYVPKTVGAIREVRDVEDKLVNLKSGHRSKFFTQLKDTFGEILLVHNVTEEKRGTLSLRNITFGIGKGESLALVGQERHGRVRLCELLSGFHLPTGGAARILNKYSLMYSPRKYSTCVTLSCEDEVCPKWMKLKNILEILGVLRGIPPQNVLDEVDMYVEALELHEVQDRVMSQLLPAERSRAQVAAALIGAPPLIILDEYIAHQKFSVRRSLYKILYHLRKKGHGILISASNVESHIPVADRLAFLVNGYIYDIDYTDNLLARYRQKGFTVVVYLKDEINVTDVFSPHFNHFIVNDAMEVLVNIQILDDGIRCLDVFLKMEKLLAQNSKIDSYVVCGTSIDYVYHSIYLSEELYHEPQPEINCCCFISMFKKHVVKPTDAMLAELKKFEETYHITKLSELPWSVVFHR